MHVVYEKIAILDEYYGPSLLEVTCHQHLDGALLVMARMRPIASTVDGLYTNAALSRISGDIVYHRCCWNNTQKCNIFLLIMYSLGGYSLMTYIVELMLSSN